MNFMTEKVDFNSDEKNFLQNTFNLYSAEILMCFGLPLSFDFFVSAHCD